MPNLLLLLLGLLLVYNVNTQESSSPLLMNGGSALAMAGKNSVAVAVDQRFASAAMGHALLQVTKPPILLMSNNVLVASIGLQTDVQSLQQELAVLLDRTKSRGLLGIAKSHELSPKTVASIASYILYRRKQTPYYVEPLVAGLDVKTGKPYLCSMDMIGARSEPMSFVCSGAASKSLQGTAEAWWRKDMMEEELVKVCGEAFLSAIERDCLSGYGCVVYLVSAEKGIVEYELESRTD